MITLGITWFFACFFSYVVIYANNFGDRQATKNFNFRYNIDIKNF